MIIPILLLVVLAIMVFLISLNECLQGSGKARIRLILFTLQLAVVVAVFAAFEWKWGLASLATVFVCALLFGPIATRVAVKILGHRSSPELMQRYSRLFHQHQQSVSAGQLFLMLEEYGLGIEDISVWPEIYQEDWNLVMSDPNLLRYFLSLVQAGENQMVIAAKVRENALSKMERL